VICNFGKAEYFFRHGLTRGLQNSLTGKSVEPYGHRDIRGRSCISDVVPALTHSEQHSSNELETRPRNSDGSRLKAGTTVQIFDWEYCCQRRNV
jgi:hypothetical protein